MLHLSETLRLFRHALTQPVTVSNADACVATSTILVHYAWATTDSVSPPDEDSGAAQGQSGLDFSMDQLFTLSQGLRKVFMNFFHFIRKNDSIFTASAGHRPRESLERATAGHAQTSEDLKTLISKAYCEQRTTAGRPITDAGDATTSLAMARFYFELQRSDELVRTAAGHPDEMCEKDAELTGFADATSRLLLVLGLFRQQPLVTDAGFSADADPTQRAEQATGAIYERDGQPPPLSDLARYLFAFPTRSTDSFIGLVRQNDPCALLILFFYYRAVSLLLPEQQCWWSCKRAHVLSAAIEHALRAKGDVRLDGVLEAGKRVFQGTSPANWTA